MGGNMKVWIVVATWFWWNAVVGPAWACPVEQHKLSWSCTLMAVEQHTFNYQVVKFTTVNVKKASYTDFIQALRAQLASGEESHGIPKTRERSKVPDSERFVLVELSNWAADSITLAVDVTNAYVVAYLSGSQSFFLKEDNPDPAIKNLFPAATVRFSFSFSGSYTDLERVADQSRETINLGMEPLENAITALRISNMEQQKPIARSLLVVIQMVAEAARFEFIKRQVRARIPTEVFLPPLTMLSYENNWGALSSAIQQSDQGGAFNKPVQLINQYGASRDVDNINDVAIKGLAIMLFICRSRSDPASTINHQHFIDHDMLMIRSVVVDADVATNVDKEVNDDDDTCAYPEPTVRISGRNGLCVDVRDGQYNNGNPIRLWPCQEQLDVNQLWTLRKDGTIRSNGMCLTTSGYSPGSHVVIYDCAAAANAATLWQVRENGSIINPQSTLALSAESGDNGTTLTVQSKIYASRQGWLASNNTEPFVTSIVGFDDLCMQANGDAMWVVTCASGNANQKWALYPDGSIRPQQDQDRCLTISSDNNSQGSIIIISSCSPGSEGQRWVSTNGGSILNLDSGMVMEVKGSDPSLHQIILSGLTGNPNQQWLPLF